MPRRDRQAAGGAGGYRLPDRQVAEDRLAGRGGGDAERFGTVQLSGGTCVGDRRHTNVVRCRVLCSHKGVRTVVLLRDSGLDRAWGWFEVAVYAAAPVLLLKYSVPRIPAWLVVGVYLGLVAVILSFPIRKWYGRHHWKNLDAGTEEGKDERGQKNGVSLRNKGKADADGLGR